MGAGATKADILNSMSQTESVNMEVPAPVAAAPVADT